MPADTAQNRVFLFLQGPHGPFFHRLGKMLRLAGAEVWRVGFNAGDRAFWFHPKSYIPYRDKPEDWPDRFTALAQEKNVRLDGVFDARGNYAFTDFVHFLLAPTPKDK